MGSGYIFFCLCSRAYADAYIHQFEFCHWSDESPLLHHCVSFIRYDHFLKMSYCQLNIYFYILMVQFFLEAVRGIQLLIACLAE